MKIKTLIIVILLLIATSCKSQAIIPTATATPLPTDTPLPTGTPSPIPTLSDMFGAIPLNSVQAFTLEPVANAIFEQTLQGYVSAGKIQEFRVDHISVFPSGNGTLDTDGWITGKCSRFDLVVTETEHQLKNKRLCS